MRERSIDPLAAQAFGLEVPTLDRALQPGGVSLPEDGSPPTLEGPLGLISSPLRVEAVIEMLYDVIDPELGVNIVDLGLLRGVEAGADGKVAIEMTLTTPGCPLGGYIEDEIRGCLAQLPQVRQVSVHVGFDPLWDPTQMTDAGREQLGWF